MTVHAQTPTDAFFSASLDQSDPALARIVAGEKSRQQDQIELIASENIVSRAVLETQGSVLTNKYAEGYPGKRYYGGCEVVDEAEVLAIERAKQLFGCDYANVQPHSGSQANQAVFMATMVPGDTFMGMDLAAGGHLTHGKSVNQSGKWFRPVAYAVRQQDHLIDYDEAAEVALAEKPKVVIAGGSAYSRHIDFARFREIADSVGATWRCSCNCSQPRPSTTSSTTCSARRAGSGIHVGTGAERGASSAGIMKMPVPIIVPTLKAQHCQNPMTLAAGATGAAFVISLIARHGERVIDAQRRTGANDVGLGECDDGRVDGEPLALHRGARREVRHGFIGLDIVGPAIRVTGVIHCVRAKKNIVRAEHFRVGQRKRQRVAKLEGG